MGLILRNEVKVSEGELRFSEIKGAGKQVSFAACPHFIVGVRYETVPNNRSRTPLNITQFLL